MRNLIALVALVSVTIVTPVAAQDATPSVSSPSAVCAPESVAAAVATPDTAATPDDASLAAIQRLPLDHFPAQVSRGEHAERGTLGLALPGPLASLKLSAEVNSGAAGPIGRVAHDADFLVFTFDEITYDVTPIKLPSGHRIASQTIQLDPSQPSTLCFDLTTGLISRNFHWILTGTNVLYDAAPSVSLGDRGRATIADVTELDPDRFTIRLLTHWESEIDLATWSVDGITLPSGHIDATADFDGTYLLDFRK
jgi:hypothetical protein